MAHNGARKTSVLLLTPRGAASVGLRCGSLLDFIGGVPFKLSGAYRCIAEHRTCQLLRAALYVCSCDSDGILTPLRGAARDNDHNDELTQLGIAHQNLQGLP